MKRLPLLTSFLLFIALCASVAYWAMQMFKPPLRPVAAPPRTVQAEVSPDAAAVLFGGRPSKGAVASNYQLRGVITAGPHDSIAILSADGKPAQAVRVGLEVAPGVTVKEVQRDYVLLSEGGAAKRVGLPESAKDLPNIASASPINNRPITPPPMPSPPPVATMPTARSQVMPPASFQQQVQPAPFPQAVPQNYSPPAGVANPSVQSSGASGTSGTYAAGAPAPQTSPQIQTSGVHAAPASPAQPLPPGAVAPVPAVPQR